MLEEARASAPASTGSLDSLPPILVDQVLDDPDPFRALIERDAPYAPVQRYFANEAEARSQSSRGPMIIAPNFRGDWAYQKTLLEGAEVFLEHTGFRAKAAELFGSELVRPFAVYSNLTWQLPFPQGGGHTDVPEFRGIDRTEHPTWLLSAMGHSRLFEDKRVQIATAVAWFYRGQDGGLDYWPEGPAGPKLVHEGDIFNTAIVGDNDRMFHRVRPVGDRARGLVQGMTLDSRLELGTEGRWRIQDRDQTLAEFGYDELRISVSWKAMVFRDAVEERAYDEHTSDLGFDDVLDRFEVDLEKRGIAMPRPSEPAHDETFIETLANAYVTDPGMIAAG